MELSEARAALRSPDEELRCIGFEELVLRALGGARAEIPVARWGAVYADLSRRLTAELNLEDNDGPSALVGRSSGLAARDLDAVWGVVYAARTFHVAQEILARYPLGPGSFADLGAGWGPFALAAALSRPDVPVTLVDLSPERLENARRLFEVAGLGAPQLVVGDARTYHATAHGGVALPYSFGEMLARERSPEESGRRLLQGWTSEMTPGGHVYVLEPGSRGSARRLQAVRDAVAERAPGVAIEAPCSGAGHCPRIADARDWCHFTWRAPVGPIARALAAAAERRWQEIHFSWLVLSRGPSRRIEALEPRAPTAPWLAGRLLEVRASAKGKVELRICTRDGELVLIGLRRNTSLVAKVERLRPGARLALDLSRLKRRGDGLRLEDDESFRIESSL